MNLCKKFCEYPNCIFLLSVDVPGNGPSFRLGRPLHGARLQPGCRRVLGSSPDNGRRSRSLPAHPQGQVRRFCHSTTSDARSLWRQSNAWMGFQARICVSSFVKGLRRSFSVEKYTFLSLAEGTKKLKLYVKVRSGRTCKNTTVGIHKRNDQLKCLNWYVFQYRIKKTCCLD
jgi:hypothetical protein